MIKHKLIEKSYDECRREYFEHKITRLQKALIWWSNQKPGKQYGEKTIDIRCSEIGMEINYIEDALNALERKENKEMALEANDYQFLARRTQNADLSNEDRVKHALFGMASEVGEIHSIYQHRIQNTGDLIDYQALKGEVGDLLWFISELCDCYSWTMEDVMNRNIEKLKKRYPDGFDTERSIHRHEIEDT